MTREEKFIKDLEHLLFLYDAELSVKFDRKDFPICLITMAAQYDDEKEIVEDFCEFELPTFMVGNKYLQDNIRYVSEKLKVTK